MPDRPKLAEPLIAVLYTRVSRDRSRRRKSVTEQDTEGREVAQREGWTIPEDAVFTDNHRSASRFATKPRVGWEALLVYLQTQPVNVLIMWETSRGDRRMTPWSELLDLCRDRKILIYIVKDDALYDPDQYRDRKALLSEGIENEGESERLSRRIQRDKRAAAFDGRPAGRLNFGYRRIYDDRGHYVKTVIEAQQAHIKRDVIDAGIVGGRSLSAIVRELNKKRDAARQQAWVDARARAAGDGNWADRWRAIRDIVARGRRWDPPEGGRWHTMTVRRLALSPTYAAKRVHGGVIVGDARWPVITEEKTFNLITAILSDPSRRKQAGTLLRYQLAGAARCARGGCNGLIRSGHRGEYRCSSCLSCSINMAAADRIINKLIVARLRIPGMVDLLTAQSDDAGVDDAEREERELQQRLDDHYREAAGGRLTARGLGIVEADLLPQIEAARARANRMRQHAIPSRLRGIDPAELAATWTDQPPAVRRDAIMLFADLRLSANSKGKRATPWRFAESRWRGDTATWGQVWVEAGETAP
jgi:site-specific DNA recombinase